MEKNWHVQWYIHASSWHKLSKVVLKSFSLGGISDVIQYLSPIPTSAGAGNNVTMSLGDFFGHADASSLGATFANGSTLVSLTNSHIQQRKYNVPLQGGFDGDNPAVPKKLKW